MSLGENQLMCRRCNGYLDVVSAEGGGRVGWVCGECETLYPEQYFDVDKRGPF